MDRLTFKAGGFNAFSSRCLSTYGGMQDDGSVTYIGGVADKLAEYEDTGITPGQIREIDRLYTEKCKELAECQKNQLTGMELANIAVGLKKLREYKDLEKQGKLLKLPVAVGDTVYAYCSIFGMLEYTVDCIVIDENITFHCSSYSEPIGDCPSECLDEIEPDISDFGKTVFLTKEAAEAALNSQKH